MFPLKLQDDELKWKLSLDYSARRDFFCLSINDVDFLALAYQAEVTLTGPQNIEQGDIKLNDEVVCEGFTQYNSYTVSQWIAEYSIWPITDILICNFVCTSEHVLNSVFEDLGRSIDA